MLAIFAFAPLYQRVASRKNSESEQKVVSSRNNSESEPTSPTGNGKKNKNKVVPARKLRKMMAKGTIVFQDVGDVYMLISMFKTEFLLRSRRESQKWWDWE